MNHRILQLSAISEPVIIQQDYDLIEYIHKNKIIEAYGHGEVEYFCDYVTFVGGPAKFGIMIVNEYYQFSWLEHTVNQVLQDKIQTGGVLYLAVNKFLADSEIQNSITEADYDLAIKQFVELHINATIESYQYNTNDRGKSFNFIHPLTRFYLRK